MNRIGIILSNFETKIFIRIRSIWGWMKRHPLWAIIIIVILISSYFLFCNYILHYTTWADWTGIGDYIGSLAKEQRGKTLWDILELLVIPIALAIIALYFNHHERESERKLSELRTQEDRKIAEQRMEEDRKIAADQQKEDILRSYLDDMGKLLIDKELKGEKDKKESPIIAVAQVKTINALRSLDKERRDYIFYFLNDAGLSEWILEGISMNNLDFSGNRINNFNLRETDMNSSNLNQTILTEVNMTSARLFKASLQGSIMSLVNLSNAILIKCDFKNVSLWKVDFNGARMDSADFRSTRFLGDVNFSKADLHGVNFAHVDFQNAILTDANLRNAVLYGANLLEADVTGAIFDYANLTGTFISRDQLFRVKSTFHTTMPDNTIH